MWEWKSDCLNSCKIHPESIIPVKWEHNDCAVLWSTEMIQSKRANSFSLARNHPFLGKEIDSIGKKLEIRVIFLNLFLTSWKRPGLLEGSNELTGEFDDPCPHPLLQIQDVPNSVRSLADHFLHLGYLHLSCFYVIFRWRNMKSVTTWFKEKKLLLYFSHYMKWNSASDNGLLRIETVFRVCSGPLIYASV